MRSTAAITRPRRIPCGCRRELKRSRQSERHPALDLGRAEHRVAGAPFGHDQGTSVVMARLGENIDIRTGSPRTNAPLQAGIIIAPFPGCPDGGIRSRSVSYMFLLRVSYGARQKISKPALPMVLPHLERQRADRHLAQAVEANATEESRAL